MTTLTLPQEAELKELVEEVFNSTQAAFEEMASKPHGIILGNAHILLEWNDDASSRLIDYIATVSKLLTITGKWRNTDALHFLSGIAWGYYRDQTRLVEILASSDIGEAMGTTNEALLACSQLITDLSETGDVIAPPGVFWMVGCRTGDHLLSLDKMREAME